MIDRLRRRPRPLPVTSYPAGQTGEGTDTEPRRRRIGRLALLALAAYIPLLLTAPGRVAADTKTYLYLDPGRLLSRAPSLLDPSIGLGTVTHQNIGYLWPMGPWFWLFELLGSPDWVAQRLWLGTIMFAAGAGVVFLMRTLAWRGPGMLAAAAIYMLSPYVLHYGARISVILLPWAGLPWLIALTQRALRRGGWRDPAAFALVVATVGGVNATALVLVGIGPLLWLTCSVVVHRESSARDALRTAARIATLSLACSLWWIAGLLVQGSYGIDILRYTETVETVARTSLASEVLRGLGYWFFYGGDLLGPWIEPGRSYTQQLWLIAVGFATPVGAFVAAVSLRWRYRAFFALLVIVGTTVAVGGHPYDDPSPLGGLFRDLATSSTVGLALRSTPRAVPLVVLGLALLVGAGIAALATRTTGLARAASLAAVAIAVAGLPPLWTGEMIGENLQRPEEIPSYWREAAAHLDARGDDTRVLVVPGADFASYRWGNTVDPVLPGLMDRPSVARELIPYGSPPSADLLMALDRRFQEGVLDPAALAPVARLLGAGDVLLRSDIQFERYRTPRPRTLAAELTPTPGGLGDPIPFGPPEPNVAARDLPLVDERTLATPDATPDPAPVTVFPVLDADPIVRTEAASRPVIVAGDGEGIVEAAAAGLLDETGVLLYDADLVGAPEVRGRALDDGAELLLTDTNRRRARRWNTVRENVGATEQAGEVALEETAVDQRLPLFPAAGDDARTVVERRGVRRVQASDYGNTISYNTEDRPANAFDGDPSTAWRVGAYGTVIGERLEVEALAPVTTDRVRLTQPLGGARNRWITSVEIRLDGERVGSFDLGDASRTEGGQEVTFDERTFTTVDLEITGDNVGGRQIDGLSGAGFSEVEVADIGVDELLRLPRTLLAEAGGSAGDHDLTVLLSRARSDPRELYRSDEETTLARVFELPGARTFTVAGQARLAARAPGAVLDEATGWLGPPTARASDRRAGDVGARASSAFDGDAATSWSPSLGDQAGRWIELEAAAPVTVDQLALQLVTDGRHSVPTRLRIEGDGAPVATVDVGSLADRAREGATSAVTIPVPAFTATTVRVVLEEVRVVQSTDSFSNAPQTLPVGIAEVGLPVPPIAAPTRLDTGCRDDLLTVDGAPVGVRITGALGGAADGRGLVLEGCDVGTALDLGSGEHVVRAADGRSTGLDLDRLVLVSPGRVPAGAQGGDDAPVVAVVGAGRTSFELDVTEVDGPFWLVLGQSHNLGWQATAAGLGDLGAPRIVDGYANGWWVDPGAAERLSISLDWAPQRTVWAGLGLSAIGTLLCLALLVVGRRRAVVRPWQGQGLLLPQLISPVAGVGGRPPMRTVVLLTLAAGATGGALVRWWVGPLVALLTLAALQWRWGRAGLTGGAVGLVVMSGAYVVLRQLRNGYPPDFGWPTFFEAAHVWSLIAIVLLVADVGVGWARRRTTIF